MNPARAIAVFAIFALLAVAARAQSSRPSQTFDTSAGAVRVTPLYHATMLIEAGGKNIYVDPAKPANFNGLPKADLILITDIHGDHMDADAIAAISKSGTQIFAPPAVVTTVTTAASISNGETKSWAGWTIEAIPMYNLK
jgi:L-ascorbate metabolism protein UlaG (beta-lactamase superfamily)